MVFGIHLRCFDRPAHNQTDLLQLPLPRKAMVSFLRFRTGCHALPKVNSGWRGCLALSGCALCVSLNIQKNGMQY